MAKSAQDLFDVQVPGNLAKNPDRAKEIGAVYLFKVTGPEGGTWTLDMVSTPPTCLQGDKGGAQCTIEVADTDFKSMLENPGLGMQLYFQGKLKVTGDPMLAMKLQKILSM